MVKHTQTISLQQQTNCISLFDHFVGLVLKGLNIALHYRNSSISLNFGFELKSSKMYLKSWF